jgi:hypothetical protein
MSHPKRGITSASFTATSKWTSFLDRLDGTWPDGELTVVEEGIQDLLEQVDHPVRDPNTSDRGVVFVGAADWGWGPSDDVQDRIRNALAANLGARFLCLICV